MYMYTCMCMCIHTWVVLVISCCVDQLLGHGVCQLQTALVLADGLLDCPYVRGDLVDVHVLLRQLSCDVQNACGVHGAVDVFVQFAFLLVEDLRPLLLVP
jgi:hypothetical protein